MGAAGGTGAAVADAAGLGLVEMEAMTKSGYDRRFSAAITAASSTIGPVVRGGIAYLADISGMPKLVARLNETYPNLVIDLDIDLTHGLWRKLRAAELDIAMLPGPAFGADLVVHDLGRAEYTWMASPRLGIPRRPLTTRPGGLRPS